MKKETCDIFDIEVNLAAAYLVLRCVSDDRTETHQVKNLSNTDEYGLNTYLLANCDNFAINLSGLLVTLFGDD